MKKVLKNLMFALTFLAFGLSSCSMDSDSPDSSSAVEKPQPQKPDPKPAPEPEPQIDTELIAAQDALKSLVERALNFADKAREGDELGQYLEGAKAELTVSIAAAQKLLDSEDKAVLKAGRLTLAKALSDFFKLKKTPTWTVIFEKGNDGDQSRVKIIWEEDEDSLDLSAVTSYESFVIDGIPAHIYWPDNANQLDSENKSVQWGPAFAPENFAPGSHTLTFRLIRGSGEESQKWDFTFEYDLEKTAETDDVIEPLFVDMDLYQPTVADLLPGLEPLISGAKEMLEKAEEGDGYGQYETGAVSAFEAVVSQAEAARNASKPEEVEDAIAAIKEAAKIFASKKNVPGWTFLFSRLEGNDQTKIEITWENEEDALTEDAIKKEKESFVLDGKVSSGFWAADGKTSGVEDKTLFYKPLFNDFYNSGLHTLEFTVIQTPKDGEKHQKEWKVTLKYNPALTVGQNTAFDLTYTDISFVKHDWAAETKKDLQDAIARAEEFAEKAAATGDEDNIYYEASDIDTFRTAISAANGVKENPLATEEEVESAIEALSEAKEGLKAAKKIRTWNVEFLRRTNDQSTVTIYWQKDEYKLENAENAVVDENGNPSVKSFRIDEVVAGQYWAGASMGNTTNENFITLVPTFAAPALNNGSHTLCFTLAKGEDEYEIEVPFTLSGESNTDECAAEIADVIVKKVDPAEKAERLLNKAKEAFQTLIEKAKQLAASVNPAAYEEGAVDRYKAAISAAENAGKTAETIEEVKAAEKALSDAEKALNSKKIIENWDVKLLRRTNDQTTVTIYWQKDEYKLEDARNAVIDANDAHTAAAFRVDDTVSHTYYPAGAADFITENNYIALKPAFYEPALHNGIHTLYFTLVKGDDEYEIEVSFTLSGKSNTDECEAEMGEVKVSKVDPAVKADKLLQKAKDDFQKQIDEVQLLVNNADASKYEDGAIDALSSAIVEANDSLAAAKTKEAVEEGKTALKKALSEFQAKKKIDMWEVSVEWLRTSQAVIEITWAKDDYKLTLDNIQDSAHPTVQSVLDANQSGHGGADGIINEINGLTLKYGINIWYWDQHLGGDDTFIIYLKNVDGKNYKLSQKFHMENGSTAEGQNRYIADSDWEISEDE